MNADSRILLIGNKGMLATAIARAIHARQLTVIGVDREQVDVTCARQVDALFDQARPTVVFNCSAMTNVDGCETDPSGADAVNGYAVGHLAAASKRHGARLVHYSTDFVFDGQSTRPYQTTDTPAPLSAYGRSKLLGERQLQQVDPRGYLLIRTAWLYGEDGHCFPRSILNAARAGKPLRVVCDQQGSPTWTGDLADATLELLGAEASGLFHVVNAGTTNWYDFTRAILDEFNVPADLSSQTSADWALTKPGAAHRPAYSVLDTTGTATVIGHALRPWRDALKDYRRAVEARG